MIDKKNCVNKHRPLFVFIHYANSLFLITVGELNTRKFKLDNINQFTPFFSFCNRFLFFPSIWVFFYSNSLNFPSSYFVVMLGIDFFFLYSLILFCDCTCGMFYVKVISINGVVYTVLICYLQYYKTLQSCIA